MLARVAVALSRFVSPITASDSQNCIKQKEEKERPSEKKSGKREDEQPRLRLVKPDEDKHPQRPPPEPDTKPPPEKATALSDQPFLQLFSLIQDKSGAISRWLGLQAYHQSLQKQRRSTRIRRGTMLDRKIE